MEGGEGRVRRQSRGFEHFLIERYELRATTFCCFRSIGAIRA